MIRRRGAASSTLLERQRRALVLVFRRRMVSIPADTIRQRAQINLVGLSRGGGPPSTQRPATAAPT